LTRNKGDIGRLARSASTSRRIYVLSPITSTLLKAFRGSLIRYGRSTLSANILWWSLYNIEPIVMGRKCFGTALSLVFGIGTVTTCLKAIGSMPVVSHMLNQHASDTFSKPFKCRFTSSVAKGVVISHSGGPSSGSSGALPSGTEGASSSGSLNVTCSRSVRGMPI